MRGGKATGGTRRARTNGTKGKRAEQGQGSGGRSVRKMLFGRVAVTLRGDSSGETEDTVKATPECRLPKVEWPGSVTPSLCDSSICDA